MYIYTHVYIHTHNGILFIQKNEILKVATICIMLSEICQRKTNISYMYNLKNKVNELIKQQQKCRLIDIEN